MLKKIGILHAHIPFVKGGAELLVENLVDKLKLDGYHAELISIPFRWYPEHSLYDSMLMWKLLDIREMNGEKIDLVIPTKFPTYGIEHPQKIPWIIHQHRAAYDLFMNKEHFGLGVIDNGYRMRDNIIRYDEVSLKDNIKDIYTISNTVTKRLKQFNDIDSMPLYPPAPLEGRYYCENYEDYILAVGRLDPIKRLDLLLEAMKFCDKKVKLKIVGMGPDRERLENLVEKLKLQDRVIFCGYVKEDKLPSLYANASIIYFAPIDEDFGYVTLEAFLSRKPIITCSDSGEVLEFVEHQKNGFVCEVNAKEIGSSINGLYCNKKRCREFGEYGYDKVRNITWRRVIDELTKTLR